MIEANGPLAAVFTGVRLAFRAIRRNVLRASLTVLGILIGVWAVVSTTALGAGARDSVASQIQSLGSNIIFIFPQNSAVSGARGAQGSGARLSEEDGRAILREAVSVSTLAPVLHARVQVVSGERNWSTNVFGTTVPYLAIRNWAIARGEPWTLHDEATKAKVCILGSSAARELFGGEDPVGRTVRLGRYPYRVLGVLESKGESPLGDDQDDLMLTPIGSMRARLLRTPPGFAGTFLVSATASETTDRAIRQLTSILRQRHRIPEGGRADFEIRSQKEFQEMQAVIYNVLTLLLVSIAGISLLVGGIGIMNIMLVSVTERTREIGIRMAIGARAGDIRTQFLVEAVVLAVAGGAAGAALGLGTIFVASAFMGWKPHLDPLPFVVALAVSGFTGVAFGFFPAQRAARLDPIDALRHE